MKRFLFVCTGNTCRSPMAEGLFKAEAEKMGKSGLLTADSAGLMAQDGSPATAEAVMVMAEIGIALSGHRSKQATLELFGWADEILVMTPDQQELLRDSFPGAREKVRLLSSNGTPDPYGRGIGDYRRCREMLKAAVQLLIEENDG